MANTSAPAAHTDTNILVAFTLNFVLTFVFRFSHAWQLGRLRCRWQTHDICSNSNSNSTGNTHAVWNNWAKREISIINISYLSSADLSLAKCDAAKKETPSCILWRRVHCAEKSLIRFNSGVQHVKYPFSGKIWPFALSSCLFRTQSVQYFTFSNIIDYTLYNMLCGYDIELQARLEPIQLSTLCTKGCTYWH